jgi:hypothetical protein
MESTSTSISLSNAAKIADVEVDRPLSACCTDCFAAYGPLAPPPTRPAMRAPSHPLYTPASIKSEICTDARAKSVSARARLCR